MNINEVINGLVDIQKKHGNIPVHLSDPREGIPVTLSVEGVDVGHCLGVEEPFVILSHFLANVKGDASARWTPN